MASTRSFYALVALCLGLLFVAVVRADDGPEDRSLEVDVNDDEVKVEARGLATGFETDRIEFELETKDGDSDLLEARFKWSVHGSEAEDTPTPTPVPATPTPAPTPAPVAPGRRASTRATTTDVSDVDAEQEQSIEFRFRLSQVIEYLEDGTTPGYQAEEDAVVSTYGSASVRRRGVQNTEAKWAAFEELADETSGTATIKSFQASTEDGVLTVKGYLSTEATLRDSVALDPNSVKLDLNINNYPFAETESFLALVARVKAEAEFDEDDGEDEQLNLKPSTAVDVTGGFGWANTLMVDGVETAVVASKFSKESEDDEGKEYYAVFSFPAHGDEYLWDPTMAVQYATSDDGGSASTLSSFMKDIFA